jgi:cyclopropane-fatty-acyl-phospholipid synthase
VSEGAAEREIASAASLVPRTGASRAERLFYDVLDRAIEDARIRFRSPGGEITVGRGSATSVCVRIERPRVFARTLAWGSLGLGEAWMDHDFEIEQGTLRDLLAVLARNEVDRVIRRSPTLLLRLAAQRIGHALRGKRRNIEVHYDWNDEVFETFLDASLGYSCGYAQTPEDDIERLQFQKYERICRKLRLAPGQRLLDIGCGYGGLLIHAAKHHGIHGLGVTIGRHHHDRGNRQIAEAGVAERVRIEFRDHTAIEGRYDRVVSVGMLEHVPRREYAIYFRNLRRVLDRDGLGLLHFIGCNSARTDHDPFIQKYVFPGSSQPRLSDVTRRLERERLPILDVENLVRHYALTGERWLERFLAHAHRLDPKRWDERFRRMFEYYLSAGIAAARGTESALYQVLFARDYRADLPLHRV